jgi:hypothetical protein
MKNTTTTSDYACIRAWDRMMGSYGYYTERQIERAREDKAPADAIYFSEARKEWSRLSNVTSPATQWYFQQHHRELVEKFAPAWLEGKAQ